MNTWQALIATVKAIPREVELAPNRWLLRLHSPVQLDDGTKGHSVCGVCRPVRPWPCDDFMEADRRIDRILNRTAA